MKYLPTTLTMIMAFGMLAVSIPVMAQDADTCEGQVGSAFGLCNAYCEAMDCDSDDPQASDIACDKVMDRFEQATGSLPPCESVPVFRGDSCDVPGETTEEASEEAYGDQYRSSCAYNYTDTTLLCYNGSWSCNSK